MKIKTISLLVGSPGAGKSTLGMSMASEGKGAIFIDDISMLVKDNPCSFINKQARENLACHIIIADVNFCFTGIREKAIKQLEEYFKLKVNVLYFENNLEKCLNNIKQRALMGDIRDVQGLAKLISKKYIIPEDVIPMTIYQSPEKKLSI